jgi:hypothetical protein
MKNKINYNIKLTSGWMLKNNKYLKIRAKIKIQIINNKNDTNFVL